MLKINQLFKKVTILTFISLFGLKVNAQQHPFKVLIVASRAKNHLKMIAAAKPFFEDLGQKNGFDVDFTDDTSKINNANLKHYQVFVMLQLAAFDMSHSQQAALQKFVKHGKGWVGIHAAGLTGKEFLGKNGIYWQWFEDLMGGVLYSPHPAFQNAKVIVEDHKHPVTMHLPDTFEISDEWYEWDKSVRSNSHVHVLASVDESTYKQRKPMGDHPVIWTNDRFKRMIYISIGHSPDDFTNQNYVTLIHDAVIWAASK